MRIFQVGKTDGISYFDEQYFLKESSANKYKQELTEKNPENFWSIYITEIYVKED